ncbi:MAG: hypothetical protein AB9856_16700 [Cellulosilyticaceae bacterium]
MHYIYAVPNKTTPHYRVYYLYKKHKIYLGLYPSEATALEALQLVESLMIQEGVPFSLKKLVPPNEMLLSFKKYISLINFRDNGLLIHNPIYIFKDYFKYYLAPDLSLTFDMKDLLFFSSNKIYKRGNYLYTKNALVQTSLLNRYGIEGYSKPGIDYYFKNGDPYDFRRQNLIVCTIYKGVSTRVHNNKTFYATKIFNEKNIVVGHYKTENEAAIAYNKACDFLESLGTPREYPRNELPFLTASEYLSLYNAISISPRLLNPHPQKRVTSAKIYRGVCKDKNGFKATIGFKGKQIYLGRYPTEKRAAQAYNLASFYLYGKQGHINPTVPLTYDGDAQNIADKLRKKGFIKKEALPKPW